jgi:hypothetical protein
MTISITVNSVAYDVPSSAADTNWAALQVAFEQALATAVNAAIAANTALAAKFVSGTGTLTSGAATVATASVAAGSRIFVTHTADDGPVGALYVPSRVNGVSFEVASNDGSDDGSFNWLIYNP